MDSEQKILNNYTGRVNFNTEQFLGKQRDMQHQRLGIVMVVR